MSEKDIIEFECKMGKVLIDFTKPDKNWWEFWK